MGGDGHLGDSLRLVSQLDHIVRRDTGYLHECSVLSRNKRFSPSRNGEPGSTCERRGNGPLLPPLHITSP